MKEVLLNQIKTQRVLINYQIRPHQTMKKMGIIVKISMFHFLKVLIIRKKVCIPRVIRKNQKRNETVNLKLGKYDN